MWLARVDLTAFADRRPARLSGGQAQRVALARALATDPDVLLLDEPLAALDAGTRMQVRTELRTHLASYRGATLLVTHDPIDALVLADRVVVIEHGRVVQTGTPTQVARQPRTRYVAQLVGLNLFRGSADGTAVTLTDGSQFTTADAFSGKVFVVIRPSSVVVHRARPGRQRAQRVGATVTTIEQHGDLVRLALSGPPDTIADITPSAVADLDAQRWRAGVVVGEGHRCRGARRRVARGLLADARGPCTFAQRLTAAMGSRAATSGLACGRHFGEHPSGEVANLLAEHVAADRQRRRVPFALVCTSRPTLGADALRPRRFEPYRCSSCDAIPRNGICTPTSTDCTSAHGTDTGRTLRMIKSVFGQPQ